MRSALASLPAKVAATAALLASACITRPTFHCASNSSCGTGNQATCEPSGFCSFPDPACPSGRRYDDYAGGGLATTCAVRGSQSPDASPAPAGPMDASIDAHSNLICNGTFEQDLASWMSFHGTIAQSSTARTGAHSLQDCLAPQEYVFGVSAPNCIATPRAGQVYTASIWVRANVGSTFVPTLSLELRELSGSSQFGPRTETNPIRLDTTWQQLTVMHTMTGDADWLSLAVNDNSDTSIDCFLLDDVEVYRTP